MCGWLRWFAHNFFYRNDMVEVKSKVLLFGYGNPGRLDDGLGPALAEAFESKHFDGLTVDADYQLTVEDAVEVAKHDVVIFADASVNGKEPFFFERLKPKADVSFSTHGIEAEGVYGLAQELFDAKTKVYILGIRGYEFNEFGQVLSDKAKDNLDKAIKFVEAALKTGNFEELADLINE
jgi:hydrogenase maturation protease